MRRGILAAGLVLAVGCTVADRTVPETLAELLKDGADAESRGDGDAAGSIYERACRAFDHAAAWARLGEHRRFWRRDPAGAEEAFRRALEAPRSTPESLASAWRGRGELARARGDVDGAVASFERSLTLHPLAETHRSLSALYATDRRDFDRAARHARAAVEAAPDDPIALLQFAVQMARFDRPREAEEAFAKAIRLAGCDASGRSADLVHCCVLYNGACYHAVRGDKEKALAMLKEFFLTPNHRHITKEEILKDPDFESLLGDADFKALLWYRLPEE